MNRAKSSRLRSEVTRAIALRFLSQFQARGDFLLRFLGAGHERTPLTAKQIHGRRRAKAARKARQLQRRLARERSRG